MRATGASRSSGWAWLWGSGRRPPRSWCPGGPREGRRSGASSRPHPRPQVRTRRAQPQLSVDSCKMNNYSPRTRSKFYPTEGGTGPRMNQLTWPYPVRTITHKHTATQFLPRICLTLWREGGGGSVWRMLRLPSPSPFAMKYNNSFLLREPHGPHHHARTEPHSPVHTLTRQLRQRLHFLWEPLGGSLISLAFNPLPLPIPSPHMADVRPRQELGEKLSGPGTPYSPPRGCLSERFWRYYRGPSPQRQAQSHGVMNFGDPWPLRARLSPHPGTRPRARSGDLRAI